MTVLDWLVDSDPAIRWQALRDLADAPDQVLRAERARVATEGWGARLLAVQGEDGQWAGGAYFPVHDEDPGRGGEPEDGSQPWTATAHSLLLPREFGIDPDDERVRRAVTSAGTAAAGRRAASRSSRARSSPASTA